MPSSPPHNQQQQLLRTPNLLVCETSSRLNAGPSNSQTADGISQVQLRRVANHHNHLADAHLHAECDEMLEAAPRDSQSLITSPVFHSAQDAPFGAEASSIEDELAAADEPVSDAEERLRRASAASSSHTSLDGAANRPSSSTRPLSEINLAYRERILRKGIMFIQSQSHLTPQQKSYNIQKLMGSTHWIPTNNSEEDLCTIISMMIESEIESNGKLPKSSIGGGSEFENAMCGASFSLPKSELLSAEAAGGRLSKAQFRKTFRRAFHKFQRRNAAAPGASSTGASIADAGTNSCNHSEASGASEDDDDAYLPLASPSSESRQRFSAYDKPLTDEDRACSYFNEEEGILGCPHYATGCKVFAQCCGTWTMCRFCHDKKTVSTDHHEMNRFECSDMLCITCHTIQPASRDCRGCGRRLAEYFCDRCRLWEDRPAEAHPIYHCDECGLCRVGRREDFVHCARCNCCLTVEWMAKHRCIERSLECNCPICGDYLFTSVLPVMFMQCGHAIHTACFYKMEMRSTHACPVCQKSVRDMSFLYRKLDEVLSAQPMPDEYAKDRSLILCNDCERRSETKYHFLYHKCVLCNSYNTKVIEVLRCPTSVGSASLQPSGGDSQAF